MSNSPDIRFPDVWSVFGPVDRDAADPAFGKMVEVPQTLVIGSHSFHGRSVSMAGGRIDLGELLGGVVMGKTAYLVALLESDCVCEVELGAGADWWMKWWVNGRVVCDTLEVGNESHPPSLCDFRFPVRLAAGRNLVAIKVVSGMGSYVLAAGGPRELRDAARTDPFAAIAATRIEEQAGLVEPRPARRPERLLPVGTRAKGHSEFGAPPPGAIADAGELSRALQAERERCAPFLRDLAPPLPVTRVTRELKQFEWRRETEADRADFLYTLAGGGVWETVSIPHYGEPLGRAVTYYRTTFEVTPELLAPGSLFVRFNGVDYKAHVFLNGCYVGSHEGFFAPFEFDVTSCARLGANVLLIKVENDTVGDKIYAATGPGWDDPEVGWQHCPPGMGIYQSVRIEARPRLFVHDIFVRPLPEEERAEAWVELWNCDLGERPARLQLAVHGLNCEGIACPAFEPEMPGAPGPRVNYYRFNIDLPGARLWEPETPWLYRLEVRLLDGDGRPLDAAARSFGMRTFRMDTEHEPRGRMYLNGREVRLRGANTMGFEQQDVMRGDFRQLVDDILLAKLCHMNFWRLTQRPVQPEVYDACDRLGLMTQTDLPLFGVLRRNQFAEAVRQAGEMERIVRAHPCNIMVTYINEPCRNGRRMKPWRNLARPDLERFFRTADEAVRLENPDRVIKAVDGDYNPPGPGLPDNHCYCCWYNGHGLDVGKLHQGYWVRVKPGWMYACGEFGAEGLDPEELMRRRYPKAWLPRSPRAEAAWTPSQIKGAQTGKMHQVFFDAQHTVSDWAEASRRHQAWATRIMTEAFRRDNRMNSFAIHLFIDAFPASWMKTIMDCERAPKPAYFAYREALTPLMANIRTDRFACSAGERMRFEAWICNDTHDVPKRARLIYQVEVAGKVVASGDCPARVRRCCSIFQGFVEWTAPGVRTRACATLRLGLATGDGQLLHATSVDVAVFPAVPKRKGKLHAVVIGEAGGRASRLAQELGLQPSFTLARRAARDTRAVLLIDCMASFAAQRETIESAVRCGATAVFLEPPIGQHVIDDSAIQVGGMMGAHFVSRDSGHPLVEGLQSNDFRLWYDPELDRIAPLLSTYIQAGGWTPILKTGDGVGGEALAAAERPCGQGLWRVCAVSLAGRIQHNPVARLFAQRLVGSDA